MTLTDEILAKLEDMETDRAEALLAWDEARARVDEARQALRDAQELLRDAEVHFGDAERDLTYASNRLKAAARGAGVVLTADGWVAR